MATNNYSVETLVRNSLDNDFQKDFFENVHPRFLTKEKLTFMCNCLFLNHIGYIVLSSMRYIAVAFQSVSPIGRRAGRGLLGRGNHPLAIYWPSDTLFLNPLGWYLNPPDFRLNDRVLSTRQSWEIRVERILGVNQQVLVVPTKGFGLKKLELIQLILEFLGPEPAFHHMPVFDDRDQSIQLYEHLYSIQG